MTFPNTTIVHPCSSMDTNPPSEETLCRRLDFITDGRLVEMPRVRQLLRLLEPIKADTPCKVAMERFLNDSSLYALPVIDASNRPIALLDRKQWFEFFGKPYTRDLFGERTLCKLLGYKNYANRNPIVLEDSCSVEDVANILIGAGIQHMVTGVVIVNNEGGYLGIANGHDLLTIITQRKQAELYYLAHYDNLTKIPNRLLLSDRLDQACISADRKGCLVALLFIDIDRFKQINDSLGHSAGDIVLGKVAERLKAVARRTDTVARLAGDEFVILMEDVTNHADVDMVAERLVQSMREPIDLIGESITVTVSIGGSIYPTDDSHINTLLLKADAAMYEAKANGRNGYRKYLPGTTKFNPATVTLENDLRNAINNDELLLHYQPQIDLSNHSVIGVEALVRWRHPQRGLVSPMQFIPLAEESGLIVPLGEWVVRHALKQIRQWQELGLPPFRIAINISALQFHQINFPEFLKAGLVEFGVDPKLVELELTESALMSNTSVVMKTMQEIKALGITLAIDDFGTGFSSLSYLRRFPIDRLKIDRSFVRDIQCTPINESIARTIVALAKSLSLGIISEGIEKVSEKSVLESIGCSEGQGFLFSKPMPADDFLVWLNAQSDIESLKIA